MPDSEIEDLLTQIYGSAETPEKTEHRNRVVDADGTPNTFQMGALRGLARRRASEPPPPAPPPAGLDPIPQAPEYEDLVPEPIEGYEDRVDVVRLIKERLGIEGAVRQFGKPQPGLKIGSRTDGIHVRCPFPAHTDNNPSAWINTVKDTWFCGGCQIGGDQIDFYAAVLHGLSGDEFHRDKTQFRDILFELAGVLGIDPEPPQAIPLDPVPEPEPQPPAPAPSRPEPVPNEPDEPITVTVEDVEAGIDPASIDWDERDSGDSDQVPCYDWTDLNLSSGTFLYEWMSYYTKWYGWIPHEYFMMLGLQLIGLACGHETTADIGSFKVNGSTMFAIIGPSQYGKSTALNHQRDLIHDAQISKFNPEDGVGIKLMKTPGSPEQLLKSIRTDIKDPLDPTREIEVPTTGLLYEHEFATFASKASRTGGGHIKQRFIELHDFSKRGDEPEIVIDDSSLTNGVRIVHDCFMSFVFLTQTDALRALVEGKDLVGGFFQRVHPVFGSSRMRRKHSTRPPSHHPFVESYANLWRAARTTTRTILEVPDSVLDYLDTNATIAHLEQMAIDNSLFGRLTMHVHRFAFLFAVNDQRRVMTVERKHYETALHLVRNYSVACYEHLTSSAKASDSKDLAVKVLEFCREYFAKKNQWPTRRDINQNPFWKVAAEQVQEMVLNNLAANQELVRLTLTAKGSGSKIVYVVTEGKWAKYASCDGKSFPKDALYANPNG